MKMRLKCQSLLMFSLLLQPVAVQSQERDDDNWELGLEVTIPVEISNVTDDVYAIEIVCWAMSSLLSKDDQTIGVGRLIIADEVFAREGIFIESEFIKMFETAEVTPEFAVEDLKDYRGEQTVYVDAYRGGTITGWTHGSCELFVMHSGYGEANPTSGTPLDCYETELSEPVALCAWPGSALQQSVQFQRAGFDEDGQPLIETTGQ